MVSPFICVMNRLVCCLLVSTFFATQNVCAQSKSYRAIIELGAGSTQYNGELGNDFFAFKTTNPFSVIRYSRYISERFDIRAGMLFGSLGFKSAISNSFDVDFFNFNFDLKFKFIKKDDTKWSPYVFVGLGMNQFSNLVLLNQQGDEIDYDVDGRFISATDQQGLKPILSVGAGIQIHVADRIYVNLEERFLFPQTDALDGIQRGTSDNMVQHTIGVGFGLSPLTTPVVDRNP